MTWIRERVQRYELGAWAFDLRDDEISEISFRGRNVLRAVRAAARDRNWLTAGWTLGEPTVSTKPVEASSAGE